MGKTVVLSHERTPTRRKIYREVEHKSGTAKLHKKPARETIKLKGQKTKFPIREVRRHKGRQSGFREIRSGIKGERIKSASWR